MVTKITKKKGRVIYITKNGDAFVDEEVAILHEKNIAEKEEARKVLQVETFGSLKDPTNTHKIIVSKNEKSHVLKLFPSMIDCTCQLLGESKEIFIVEEYDNGDYYYDSCNLIRLKDFER